MKKKNKSETTTLSQMADELIIANKKLAYQNEEKAKRASELVIAKADKARRAAELVIAKADKAKRAAELVIANAEKEKRADELIIADKELVYQNEEKAKRAAELVIADVNKTKREAELVIAKIEKAKLIAKSIIADKELSFQTKEKSKRAAELVIADAEKSKRAAELVIANIKKAKRSAELVIANIEKAKRSAELVIAHKELVYQKSEKSKRAAELVIANVEKAKRAAEFVIANIEKSKRAAEFVFMNKELVLAKEKEKLVVELTLINKELTIQITERKQSDKALFESEERFRLLFNQAPLGYQSLDFDGNFIDVNQQWLDTLGYTREEVVGKWFGDFLSPAYQDGFRKRFPIFKEQGHIHSEFEMVHKNGNILFIAFEGRIGYDTKGEFKQTHCILQDITERKKAEKTLQDIIDYNPMAIQILDAEGFTLKVNQAFMLLYGSIPPSDYSMFNDVQLIEKGFGESINHIKNGEVVHFPDMSFNPHDSVPEMPDAPVWVRTIVFPLVDGTGKPDKFVFMHENITERKQADESMVKSTLKYQELTESISDVFFAFDKNLKYRYWNKACETLTGISTENAIGKSLKDIFPDNKSRQQVEDLCLQAIESEKPQYRTITYPNNDNIIHEISAYPNIEGISVFVKDITERKQAEIELIKAKEKAEVSENRLSSVFNAMSEGFSIQEVICDDNGKPIDLRFIDANPAFEIQTGLKNSETLGHTLLELFPTSEPLWIERYGHVGLSGEPMTFEAMFGPLNIYYHCNAFQIKHGFFGTMFTDINERKQAELLIQEKNEALTQINIKLFQAKEKAEESDRLKSSFLTNMSHEIRTPMNGILGFTELLKEPNLSSDDIQDYIQTIQISGARMLNTINSIVNISKIESGLIDIDIKETNLNEKIEFTYRFFKPEVEIKGLQFLFKNGLPTNEAIIKTDNEKVYGILTNLVRNALKFTYDGSIEFGYEKKGEYLEFFVKDTGVGIPKNQQEIIFERFRQGSESHNRGYEGSGLGLSISKSYVEMLGGSIWVESEEGRGSTFYFTIPYISESVIQTEIRSAAPAEHKEGQLKNLKVLVVEDDEVSHSLLTRNLQKISKEVLHAITGVQAIEACRNNPDLDLVLMDIRMPQMSGLEATQLIRQFNKTVIIIAQTAYAFSGDREKALEAGCNDYISKPINMNLLLEVIKKSILILKPENSQS